MADPAPAPAPDSGKGNSSSIIVAVAVAVIMLVGGAAIAQFIMVPQIVKQIAKNAPAAPAGGEGGGEKKEGGEGMKGGATANFVISDILVNISGTKAGRFLKATAYFDASPAVVAELERRRPQITDIVSATLGQKSLDELSDPGARGKLRSELLATINPLLETKGGEVTNIYFPEFIIQ